MDARISQRELRNDSGDNMRRVEQGESFTVTRDGTPVADLVPHGAEGASHAPRFVPVESISAGAAALPSWHVEQFSEELRELDRALHDRGIDRWSGGPR